MRSNTQRVSGGKTARLALLLVALSIMLAGGDMVREGRQELWNGPDASQVVAIQGNNPMVENAVLNPSAVPQSPHRRCKDHGMVARSLQDGMTNSGGSGENSP